MREIKTKQVRKLSKEFVVEWLQSMLTEEEQKKVSVDNYEKYLLYIVNKEVDESINKKITKFYIKLYELVYLEKFDFSILNK